MDTKIETNHRYGGRKVSRFGGNRPLHVKKEEVTKMSDPSLPTSPPLYQMEAQ